MSITKTAACAIITIVLIFSAGCLSAHSKGLRITLVEGKILDNLNNGTDIGKNNKLLSVKLRVDYPGNEPVSLSVNSIILKTTSGEICKLAGIGGGAGQMDAFNVYFPFEAPWTPFSMKYQESENEKELFGLKQGSPSETPAIAFYKKDKIMLFGFVVPSGATAFQLSVGDSNIIKVSAQ